MPNFEPDVLSPHPKPPMPGCWSNLVTVSIFETTRTVTGAQVTPICCSSVRRASCRRDESTSVWRSAEGGTLRSSVRVLPRVIRQLSQKKRTSSGVSSPLYRPQVQCSHELHSSHCTQLSTNSGRSFSFFSRNESICRFVLCARSHSKRFGCDEALMSA